MGVHGVRGRACADGGRVGGSVARVAAVEGKLEELGAPRHEQGLKGDDAL